MAVAAEKQQQQQKQTRARYFRRCFFFEGSKFSRKFFSGFQILKTSFSSFDDTDFSLNHFQFTGLCSLDDKQQQKLLPNLLLTLDLVHTR